MKYPYIFLLIKINLAHSLISHLCAKKSLDVLYLSISSDQVYQKLSIFLVLAQAKPCASDQALEFLLSLVALSCEYFHCSVAYQVILSLLFHVSLRISFINI
jgi:hypothetical protein